MFLATEQMQGLCLYSYFTLILAVHTAHANEETDAETQIPTAADNTVAAASLSIWFKLLVIPTLAVLILSVFLLEDHCYKQQAANRRKASQQNNDARHNTNGTATSTLQRAIKQAVTCTKEAYAVVRTLLQSPEPNNIDARDSSSRKRSQPSRARSASAASASSSSSSLSSQSSSSSCPSPSPRSATMDPIRVCLVNTAGVSHCYKISLNTPLAEIVSFYLDKLADKKDKDTEDKLTNGDKQTAEGGDNSSESCTGHEQQSNGVEKLNGHATSSKTASSILGSAASSIASFPPSLPSSLPAGNVVLRYEGRKLPMECTAQQLGLQDMAVIEVEPDYLSLFNTVRVATDAIRDQAERELHIEQQAAQTAQHIITQQQTQCQQIQTQMKDIRDQMKQSQLQRQKMMTEMEKMQAEIAQEEQARAEIESSLSTIDADQSELRAARVALESQLSESKAQHSILQAELDILKQSYTHAVQQRSEAKDKSRDLLQQFEQVEKDLNVWKIKAQNMQTNKDKIDKVDKMIQDAVQYQQRITMNTLEMQKLEEEMVLIREKHVMKEEKEKELNAIKLRLKQLDKEVKDGMKWKVQVKALEKEGKEAERWKALLKQGKVREKNLEKDMKELHHWRQRARAFEKEVKELRGWKRIIIEQARENGREAMIPEFPLDGGLDSSGSGGDLMSSGSGINTHSGADSSAASSLSGSSPASSGAALSAGLSSQMMDGSRFFDLIRGANRAGYNQPNVNAEYTEYDFDAESGIGLDSHSALDYDLLGVDDDDMDLPSMIQPDLHSIEQSDYTQYNAQGEDRQMIMPDPEQDPQYQQLYQERDDDDADLLQAGRSDKSIKAAISETTNLQARQSQEQQLQLHQHHRQLQPQHQHLHSTSFFPSWQPPVSVSASPLLIIDDRQVATPAASVSNTSLSPSHLTTSRGMSSSSALSTGSSSSSSAYTQSMSASGPIVDHVVVQDEDRESVSGNGIGRTVMNRGMSVPLPPLYPHASIHPNLLLNQHNHSIATTATPSPQHQHHRSHSGSWSNAQVDAAQLQHRFTPPLLIIEDTKTNTHHSPRQIDNSQPAPAARHSN